MQLRRSRGSEPSEKVLQLRALLEQQWELLANFDSADPIAEEQV